MTIAFQDQNPGSWRLRGGRMSAPFQTYFVTKCVESRRPILAVASAAEIVIGSLAHVRRQGQIKLLAFVIMPDHYHAVFTLLPGAELSALMRRIGSFTGRRIGEVLGLVHPVWQDDGFHDRACRTDKEVLDAAEYVHNNPVRRGLTELAEDWPFSSAHPGRRDLLDWDWWV